MPAGAAALVLVLAATGIAVAAGSSSTVNATIADRDGDNRLEPAPGDDYLRRDELGTRTPRACGPGAADLGQLTDFQLVDEESPARVEFLDKVGPPFTAAYRPQEGTGPQVVDSMVRQMRNAVSPVTHRGIDAVMTTGDNTDNTQCNKARWMIDILDGAANADPRSASRRACGRRPARGSQLGRRGQLRHRAGRERLRRRRGDREYYEPDASDGRTARATRRARSRTRRRPALQPVRDFPGLFERMNEPFLPAGFGDVPWYGSSATTTGSCRATRTATPRSTRSRPAA